jgi:hypothetical protein
MASKEEVRPIYAELQGYLTQTPDKKEYFYIDNHFIWEKYNALVGELQKVTGRNYSRFLLVPEGGQIETILYRQNLGGLIARLHGEYFSDEVAPFAEMPSTIITQSQNQTQSLQVQLLFEVYDLIHEKLSTVQEGSKEKTFLEKVKASLSSVKDVSQLVTLLITTAHQLGITIEQLKTLFS